MGVVTSYDMPAERGGQQRFVPDASQFGVIGTRPVGPWHDGEFEIRLATAGPGRPGIPPRVSKSHLKTPVSRLRFRREPVGGGWRPISQRHDFPSTWNTEFGLPDVSRGHVTLSDIEPARGVPWLSHSVEPSRWHFVSGGRRGSPNGGAPGGFSNGSRAMEETIRDDGPLTKQQRDPNAEQLTIASSGNVPRSIRKTESDCGPFPKWP